MEKDKRNGSRASTNGKAKREWGNSLLQMQNALFSVLFWANPGTKRLRKRKLLDTKGRKKSQPLERDQKGGTTLLETDEILKRAFGSMPISILESALIFVPVVIVYVCAYCV